ncbi:MAG TPA: GMC family oxidoreductase, partial [Gemmatimonadaceae bacterium]
DGAVIGWRYDGLRATRHRQVGGSAHLWNTCIDGCPGAKYVPLDRADFEPHDDIPNSGWPFDHTHLERFYQRAHVACGLGVFDYEPNRWASTDRQMLTRCDDDGMTTRVYHVGSADRFTVEHASAVRASDNIQLVHHSTCCSLLMDGARRVVAVAAKTSTHATYHVGARLFVLAAGAIENARILLLSGDPQLNQHGWVGRCFMEHPRDRALRLVPRSADVFREISFYDLHQRDDSWVIGRLALGASTLRSHGFPNASVTLVPLLRRRRWAAAVGSLLGERRLPFFNSRRALAFGWSWPGDLAARCDELQILINLEQHPHRDNRVVLSAQRDALGVPRAALHWQWREKEHATLGRLRTFVGDRLRMLGLGQVENTDDGIPDPNAHHHAGTTRMSSDPGQGVVDADCRVHGSDNLYVAGSSVFPTAGFANPTLTIVALALRLADHLETRL